MIRSALVVGAGIVGAAVADWLQGAGCAVTLFEAGIPGGGTTAGGMGHLATLDGSSPMLAFTARGVTLWSREVLPGSCAREARGTLWVVRDDGEREEVRAAAARFAQVGVAAEVLDAERLKAEEPALRPGLGGGLLVPGDQVLYPPGAARFLLDRALGRGTVLVREPVRALESGGLSTASGRYQADAVVVAAGLGSPGLLPELAMVPRKGHLAITVPVPGLVRHQLLEWGYLRSAHGRDAASVAFNVQPRSTGQVVIGSSREFAGVSLDSRGRMRALEDPAPNRPLLSSMLREAVEFIPALARVPVVRVWTGFRPCGPGNLPAIGPWPGREGVYLATGHEGLGITTALVTAELIGHHLLGTPSVLDPAPFLPAVPAPTLP